MSIEDFTVIILPPSILFRASLYMVYITSNNVFRSVLKFLKISEKYFPFIENFILLHDDDDLYL